MTNIEQCDYTLQQVEDTLKQVKFVRRIIDLVLNRDAPLADPELDEEKGSI